MSLSDVALNYRDADESVGDRIVEASEEEIEPQRGLEAHVSH